MRLFVVGANGYIGDRLLGVARRVLPVAGSSSRGSDELLRLDLNKVNDFDYALLHRGDVICMTAAISAPEVCSREHARAWVVNVTGTSAFIARALDRGARVVFFSSDTVYGEAAQLIDERAPVSPVGEYAAMKAEVERTFSGESEFKSIRLSYVFSSEDKFTRYLRGCAERREIAEVFDPFCRSVVHREDVVAGVISLAMRWDEIPAPVLNFGGPANISRVAFAELVKRIELPTLEIKTVAPGPEFFVSRPRVINLGSPLLSQLLGRPLTSLADAIAIEFYKEI